MKQQHFVKTKTKQSNRHINNVITSINILLINR